MERDGERRDPQIGQDGFVAAAGKQGQSLCFGVPQLAVLWALCASKSSNFEALGTQRSDLPPGPEEEEGEAKVRLRLLAASHCKAPALESGRLGSGRLVSSKLPLPAISWRLTPAELAAKKAKQAEARRLGTWILA